MSGDDGESISPDSQAAFDNALRMMEFTHRASLEQMDKVLELKRLHIQMLKESKYAVSDSNTTT
jgi:hypothetical protein